MLLGAFSVGWSLSAKQMQMFEYMDYFEYTDYNGYVKTLQPVIGLERVASAGA